MKLSSPLSARQVSFFLMLFLLYAFSASADGLLPFPDWVLKSNEHIENLGSGVDSAGDVNGDGFDDVVIGSPGVNRLGDDWQGEVYVFFGSPEGLSTQPDWTARGEDWVSEFGAQVSSAGDVNGDGYDDILICDPHFRPPDHGMWEQEFGKLYLYLGSASGPSSSPDWTIEGYRSLLRLGNAVSDAGDVNGDGFYDLLVGVPEDNEAWLFYGSPSGLGDQADWVYTTFGEYDTFGKEVSTAGDINGDGFSDVIISNTSYSDNIFHHGRVYGFYGSVDGLGDTPDWEIGMPANALYETLGTSLAEAGDVNDDGYSDVIIGTGVCVAKGQCHGRVLLYYGFEAGLETTPSWSRNYPLQTVSVSKAGDVNSDGIGDVLIGSNVITMSSYTGKCDAFYGSSAGLSETPDWTAYGENTQSLFGYTLAFAGDVNADTFDDVIISDLNFRPASDLESRVYAYYGHEPGCIIGETYYHDGEVDPNSPCRICASNISATTWSPNDDAVCDDGLFCNGVDSCLDGLCTVHAGDPCPEFCDESADQCASDDDNDDQPGENEDDETDDNDNGCGI